MNDQMLPLFPLQVVLFPGSALPLHIFEERYKQLINECIEEGKEFGINLVHEGKVSDVGCTAEVSEVVREYGDGRLDIIVRGKQRYQLQRVETDAAPYLVGHVDLLDDRDVSADRELERETIELYNQLISIVYGDKKHALAMEPGRESLSFKVAQKAGLGILERQQLLEQGSENARLEILRHYLQDVIPKLKTYREVEKVIRSDGYL